MNDHATMWDQRVGSNCRTAVPIEVLEGNTTGFQGAAEGSIVSLYDTTLLNSSL